MIFFCIFVEQNNTETFIMIINLLTISFINSLQAHEVPLFRGAIIKALNDKQILFHNHLGDEKYRYSYPLIQYKVLGGKAAMVCVGEGTQAIGEFFASGNFDVMIGERSERLQLARVEPRRHNVQVWGQLFHYRLRRWLPLNGENYRKYQATASLADRCALLEGVLKGNILSMGKGVGVDFDSPINCSITSLDEPYVIRVKGIKMLCFNIDFCSNVSLPAHVGLGKHASINCGILYPRRKGPVVQDQTPVDE